MDWIYPGRARFSSRLHRAHSDLLAGAALKAVQSQPENVRTKGITMQERSPVFVC